jgi:hypothetical protein
MAIDLNFDNVTLAIFTLSGRLLKLKRFKTPHRRILTHRYGLRGSRRGTRGLGGSSGALGGLSRGMARG